MTFLLHWLYIHLGIRGTGSYYGFWSGAGSDVSELALLGGVMALVKKHQCHVPWCWRFGHYQEPDGQRMLCRRHHPEM